MPRRSLLTRGLNPEQVEAVRRTKGPVLVLAGAGSGKTRVITTRIAYLIEQGLAKPGEILALTFTNKAAAEMRERVAKIIGADLARDIVLSTFHSFCVRVLRAEIEHVGYRRNFTITAESDTRTLLRRTLEDLDGAGETFDAGTFLERIGQLKSAGIDPAGAADTPALPKGAAKSPEADKKKAATAEKYEKWLPEIYERYQSALRAANAVDFDDLLLLTLRLWREHPRVLGRYQKRFRYVMVDEYQDTNRVQYELLLALTGKHRNLCVVGDDDQSIYSWRGADIANIISFERDFPEAHVVKLEQNYRSSETILDAANHVIACNTVRRPKNLWSQLGKGRRVDWFITGDEEQEAAEAAKLLRYIRGQTGAAYRNFAVLYRANQQSRPYEIAFRQANIPYVVVGGQEFFERAEVKDLIAYLKIIANPRDEAAFLRIINVPRRGIGDVTLHRAHDICRTQSMGLGKALVSLLKGGDLPRNTQAGIRQFLGIVNTFRQKYRDCEGRLASVTVELVDHVRYRADLFRSSKSAAQFEARWGNVEALISAVAQYEEQNERPTLSGFLDDSALVTNEDRRDKEERRSEAVTLMTIHSAKGLEFPYVFIAGVEEGLLPHEKSTGKEAIEEERRLFYVALTRAKRHAVLFESMSRERYGKRRMTKTSRFVAEIPEALIRRRIRAARDMVADSTGESAPKPRKRKPTRKRR
ncbi:MAG: UvrD-helicase domain-containing protein [Nitrospiraceae bacterium]|nr:UvrD-helicase domain-containing protein [Nitrospiraceae bacterium]